MIYIAKGAVEDVIHLAHYSGLSCERSLKQRRFQGHMLKGREKCLVLDSTVCQLLM